MNFCTVGSYTLPDGTAVQIFPSTNTVKKQVEDTKFHLFWEPEDKFPVQLICFLVTDIQVFPQLVERSEIAVMDVDCLDLGIYLKTKLGLNPVVLNMCSPNLPGGGTRLFKD